MKQERLDLIKQRRELAGQAASYFEQRQYWEALSEALDAYGVLAISSYALPEALAAMERRLSIPDLPIVEWADAVGSVICCLFLMGNYDGCITSVHETFANLKPGQPVARLGRVVSYGMLAAYLSGRWEEVEKLLPRLDEIHELVGYDSAASSQLVRGYYAMLLVALVREDHTLIEKISARLHQDAEYLGSFFLNTVDALIADDARQLSQQLPVHMGGDTIDTALMLFANEHGYALPEELLARVKDTSESNRSLLDIAHALAANDLAWLAQAINGAAVHHLEHHAARMRIILSNLSHDPGPLDLARPVLERLGDHQFLRRLAEVELKIYV